MYNQLSSSPVVAMLSGEHLDVEKKVLSEPVELSADHFSS